MPDAPDSYQYELNSQRGLLADMAELAARLDSPNTFVRTGITIFQDTFKNGLSSWQVGSLSESSKARLKLGKGLTNGVCLNLHCEGVGATSVQVTRSFNIPELQRLGVEFGINFPDDYKTFIFGFVIEDNGTRYIAYFQFNTTTGKIYYVNSAGSYVELADIPVEDNDIERFDQIKLVIDPDIAEYIRFQYNQNVYSMADLGLRVISTTTQSQMYFYFIGNSNVGTLTDFYIDYIILTTGEI